LLLNNALRISKILNNDFLVATSIKSLADFYLYSNDYVHAISLYEKASSYMENKNHFVLKTMIILRLSEAFEQNGEIEKALSCSFIGLEVAQQNLFMAGEKFAHQVLSRLFERKLDTEKSFKHLKAYLDLHNRINTSKQMNKINKMELDFVKEAKDKEIYLLEQIKEKHKAISESISYAKRLQEAILPINKSLEDSSINYFVFFKPKEKVGGDFYWIDSSENSSIFCLADCTGHGIPGAMLSMLCSNLVRNALKNNKKPHLNNIISKVNNMLHDTLGLNEINNVNDGMDISFCSISKKPKSDYWELKFAGANHVGIIISEDKALQVAYNRTGISIQTDRDYKFDETIYRLKKGDSFYMFSDGYADQFGGLTEEERKQGGKKFKYNRLTELFTNIHKEELIEQRQILENTLNEWMGDLEQIDDVTVIGFRV
jgi:serine phosphatase RsbU (regulator of sigma subunit)